MIEPPKMTELLEMREPVEMRQHKNTKTHGEKDSKNQKKLSMKQMTAEMIEAPEVLESLHVRVHNKAKQ